jgi:pimeloyl-ACP methyl ester carboxylesterase
MNHLAHRSVDVDGFEIFYREAGDPEKPSLLLLHGFPTSSHMFSGLIPILAEDFHLVAPDLPGFGRSALPPRGTFAYTFDNLANVIDRFTEVLGMTQFAVYIFDYGAPVGLRLALAHPERITAIISQNGNAYEEGLSDGWSPIERYWKAPTLENREALRGMLAPQSIRWQYEHGVSDLSRISPDGIALDVFYMQRPGADEIQLDLMLDYASNVALYPTFQAYFRQHQPKLLAIWGDKDPFFLPPGAKAYQRDLPNAQVQFLDTGHFALTTHAGEIAEGIRSLMKA